MIALLLAACAHVQASYGPPVAVPLVHTSVDVDRWYIPVETPAGDQVLFLDTGYARSTCDDGLADTLGLALHGRVVIHGEAGKVVARRADLPALQLGGQTVTGLACHVRDLNTSSSIEDPPEVPVAGVLGVDALRPFFVVIDPAVPALWLYPPAERRLARRDPGVVPLRRELRFGRRVSVPLVVDGVELRPLVDTGASITHVNGRYLPLTAGWERSGVVVHGTGTGTAVRTLHYLRPTALSLGDNPIAPRDLVDRRRLAAEGGLLGVDLLGDFTQEYDFAHGLARFTPAAAAPVPPWERWARRGQPAPVALGVEAEVPR